MIIAGFTGNIGSGKSTFGGLIAKVATGHLHLEASSLIAEIANELRKNRPSVIPNTKDLEAINAWLSVLPEIIKQHLHTNIEWHQIELRPQDIAIHPEQFEKLFAYIELLHDKPDLFEGDITTSNKGDHRALLQWLGGYFAKRISGDIWFQALIARGNTTAGTELLTLGGVRFPADAACIRAHGGLIVELQRPELVAQDQSDITERERNQVQADILIMNNGNLIELETIASQFYKDITHGETAKVYSARNDQY